MFLGRAGSRCIHVIWHQNGTTVRKLSRNGTRLSSCIFFVPNSNFDVPDRFSRSISRSPANFKKIGEDHISLYHVTWSHRLKIAIFKSCSDSLDMGRVCSDPAKTFVVTLQSFKMIGRLEVR